MDNQSKTTAIDLLKAFIALIFLAAIVVGALLLFLHFASPMLQGIADVFSKTDVAIMVAFVTGAISIITVIVGAIVKTKLEYTQRQREFLTQQRIKPYEKLISIVYKIQMKTKTGEEYTQAEMLDDMGDFNQGLTLWGSRKAIQKWNSWRAMSATAAPNPKETLYAMEAVMIQLRADLMNDRGLKRGDLLRMFVNDLDE